MKLIRICEDWYFRGTALRCSQQLQKKDGPKVLFALEKMYNGAVKEGFSQSKLFSEADGCSSTFLETGLKHKKSHVSMNECFFGAVAPSWKRD